MNTDVATRRDICMTGNIRDASGAHIKFQLLRLVYHHLDYLPTPYFCPAMDIDKLFKVCKIMCATVCVVTDFNVSKDAQDSDKQ